ATRAGCFMEDEQPVGLPDGVKDGRAIPRDERTKVNDLQRSPEVGKMFRLFERPVDADAVRDDCEVRPLGRNPRAAEIDLVGIVRYASLEWAIEVLVLEVQDRIGITDRAH